MFISSTYTDLKEERLAVTQCLLDNDCIPVGMEQFPASGMAQMEYIKRMLDDCDYYILILAGRYGSLDVDGMGFTEKEFDYANSKKIPIMSFVIENQNALTLANSESTEIGRSKLEVFRRKVCTGRMVKFYNNIDQLKAYVAISINKCIKDFPAIGWIRGNNLTSGSNLDVQIAKYLEEHTISSEEIDAIVNNDIIFPNTAPTISAQYQNIENSGCFCFDYSNNNGEYTIGDGRNLFVTKWSKASNTSIHAYIGGDGIVGLARIKAPIDLQSALLSPCDFSSRTRTPQIGDVIIWKNKFGQYAGTQILSIKDDTRGEAKDELSCEYMIYKQEQIQQIELK